MSNPDLPQELVDVIVDLLHDASDALKNCCLVSKSWIPRARKHLFANVLFRDAKDLQSWKTTFPNPSTSPAHHTQALFIEFSPYVTAEDTEEGGWIPTFSRVVRFEIRAQLFEPENRSFLSFRGFSPVLKYLHVSYVPLSPLDVCSLVYSFPLLEDLRLATTGRFDTDDLYGGKPATIQPSDLPPLTGTLKLSLNMKTHPMISWLLSAPVGPHFRNLNLAWVFQGDASFITALVEKCSSTLEYLRIDSHIYDNSLSYFFNLSRATKLKDVAFMCPRDPRWAAMTIRTITPDHTNLRQISVCYWNRYLYPEGTNSAHFRAMIGEAAYQEWLDFDRLLVRLCESHPIRLRVLYGGSTSTASNSVARSCMESLFPEATARGIIDLINYDDAGWDWRISDWTNSNPKELM